MPNVLKSGSLNLLEPSGPVPACNGIADYRASTENYELYTHELKNRYRSRRKEREVIYLIGLRSNVGWIGLTSFSGRSGVTWAIRHSLFMGSRWVMCIKLVLDTSFAAPLSHKGGCCMYVYARIKNSINGPKIRIMINTKKSLFSDLRQNFSVVCQYTEPIPAAARS